MSDMDKVENINITPSGDKLVILYGKEPDFVPPLNLSIIGCITSPADWLEKRVAEVNKSGCFVSCNRDALEIVIIINETDKQRLGNIIGVLKASDDFVKFGINSDKSWTTFNLANFIKMNRTAFESKEVAADLVMKLRDFKATVDKQIEMKKDDRANSSAIRNQVVNTNIPTGFTLNIPLFKGMERKKFGVEICIDSETLNCSLVSPDAADLIRETSDKIIDEQIERIKTICPEIPIIMQ